MTSNEGQFADREAEARAFFCGDDPEANARWDAGSDADRAKWTKDHGSLLSVKLERFEREHPVAHNFASGEAAVSLMRTMAAPYVWAWRKVTRRG